MAHSPKSVRHLLKDKPTLKLLQLEISAQKALLDQVRRHLPGKLADHCVAARLRDRQLILHTDAPVWATRLRFLSPQLISLLASERLSLREIRIRVLPRRTPRRPQQRAPRHSDCAAAIVRENARGTQQTALRAALERLGKALKKR